MRKTSLAGARAEGSAGCRAGCGACRAQEQRGDTIAHLWEHADYTLCQLASGQAGRWDRPHASSRLQQAVGAEHAPVQLQLGAGRDARCHELQQVGLHA